MRESESDDPEWENNVVAVEMARALVCDRLLALGYEKGDDPIWLARLLVSRDVLLRLMIRMLA